jgi:hypothetical protein
VARDFHQELIDCQQANMHVKTGPTGVVQFGENGEPIMAYDTGACDLERIAFDEHETLLEDRRIKKDYISSACSQYKGTILYCVNATMERCVTVDRGTVKVRKFCGCVCANKGSVVRIINRGY